MKKHVRDERILLEFNVEGEFGGGDEGASNTGCCMDEGEGAEGTLVEGGEHDGRIDRGGLVNLEISDGGEDSFADSVVVDAGLDCGSGGGALGHEFDKGGGQELAIENERMIGGNEAGGGHAELVGGKGSVIKPVHRRGMRKKGWGHVISRRIGFGGLGKGDSFFIQSGGDHLVGFSAKDGVALGVRGVGIEDAEWLNGDRLAEDPGLTGWEAIEGAMNSDGDDGATGACGEEEGAVTEARELTGTTAGGFWENEKGGAVGEAGLGIRKNIKVLDKEVPGEFHQPAEKRDAEWPAFGPDTAITDFKRKSHEENGIHRGAMVGDDDAGTDGGPIEGGGEDFERIACKPQVVTNEIGEDGAGDTPGGDSFAIKGVRGKNKIWSKEQKIEENAEPKCEVDVGGEEHIPRAGRATNGGGNSTGTFQQGAAPAVCRSTGVDCAASDSRRVTVRSSLAVMPARMAGRAATVAAWEALMRAGSIPSCRRTMSWPETCLRTLSTIFSLVSGRVS